MTKRKFYLQSLYWLLGIIVLAFISGAIFVASFIWGAIFEALALFLILGWVYFTYRPAFQSKDFFISKSGSKIKLILISTIFAIAYLFIISASMMLGYVTIGSTEWMEVNAEKMSGDIFTDGWDIFITPENDVYIVGSRCYGTSLTNQPILWINGDPQQIGEEGNYNYASNVFVEGKDVYAVVKVNYYEGEYSKDKYYLWSNGEVSLEGNHYLNDVFVKNKKVYVVGDEDPDKEGRPVLWIDGKKQVLSDQKGSANSIYLSEDKMYIAGTLFENDSPKAVLWVNSELTVLSENGTASALCVVGDDVYVLGSIEEGDSSRGVFWKNGEATYIDIALPECITVADGKIYIGGGDGYNPNLWISGENITLPEDMRQNITSLKYSGGKLYISADSRGPSPLWIYNGSTIEKVEFNK